MGGSLRIRRADVTDAAAIADVLRRAFLEFEPLYTPQGFAATTPAEFQIRRRIEEGPAWVALWQDEIAGTAAAVLQGEKGLYVRGVAVLPAARGCGIAEAMMQEVERFARNEVALECFWPRLRFWTVRSGYTSASVSGAQGTRICSELRC